MGSIRELGGGAFESAEYALNKAAGRNVEWPHRLSYIIALTTFTALMGAVMTYLFTGHGPQTIKQLLGSRKVPPACRGITWSRDG